MLPVLVNDLHHNPQDTLIAEIIVATRINTVAIPLAEYALFEELLAHRLLAVHQELENSVGVLPTYNVILD